MDKEEKSFMNVWIMTNFNIIWKKTPIKLKSVKHMPL